MKRFLPNLLTGIRLVSPLLLWSVADNPVLLSCVFFFAAFTDFVDGALARKWGCQSAFGKVLDPLADKLLIISSLGMLVLKGLVSQHLFFLVLLRDVLIILGTGLLWLRGQSPFSPFWISKANTVCQIILCFLGFIQLSFPFPYATHILYDVSILLWVTTLWSGCAYMIVGARVLWSR